MIQARPTSELIDHPIIMRLRRCATGKPERGGVGRGEQPRMVPEMCGSVGGHLQTGRPQTVPAQLSHLSQEVFLELHPVGGPKLVQCCYIKAPKRTRHGSVNTCCGSTGRYNRYPGTVSSGEGGSLAYDISQLQYKKRGETEHTIGTRAECRASELVREKYSNRRDGNGRQAAWDDLQRLNRKGSVVTISNGLSCNAPSRISMPYVG